MKFKLFFFCLINPMFFVAQTYELEWVNANSGNGRVEGKSIAYDKNGFVYSCGQFEDTVDFDPGASSYRIHSNGRSDMFIQKLDAQGNLIWVRTFGGKKNDYCNSIVTDSVGNVYVTGVFTDSVSFGSTDTLQSLRKNGSPGIFVLKLNGNGAIQWVTSIKGSDQISGYSIYSDGSDDVYVCGGFSDTIFPNPAMPNYGQIAKGFGDAFLWKLDGIGNFKWFKSWGGSNIVTTARAIAVDANKNVYTTGSFSGLFVPMDIDPGVNMHNLYSKGSDDVFVQKLDQNGNFIWGKSLGGSGSDIGKFISVDATNNVLITGMFKDTVDFDPDSLVNISQSQGFWDVFILKLNSWGNYDWHKVIGGSGEDFGLSIVTDDTGNVYSAGFYSGMVDFNPSSSTFHLNSAQGSRDGFIQKLDANGNFVWAKSFGGPQRDLFNSIVLGNPGELYATGLFSNTADFDPSLATYYLTSSGYWDSFTIKLSRCGQVQGIDKIRACNSLTWVDGKVYNASIYGPTFTSTNVNGCDSTSTLDLIIIKIDNTIKVQDSILSSNAIADSYQWLDCNFNFAIIPNETLQSYTASTNGKYAVALTKDGCVDTSDCADVSILNVSKTSIKNKIEIIPNPNQGKFTVKIYKGNFEMIQIFSAQGKLILSKPLPANCKEFTVHETLPSGYYFVHFYSENNVKTEKMIIH